MIIVIVAAASYMCYVFAGNSCIFSEVSGVITEIGEASGKC